jgi:hypothetical protein
VNNDDPPVGGHREEAAQEIKRPVAGHPAAVVRSTTLADVPANLIGSLIELAPRLVIADYFRTKQPTIEANLAAAN